MHRDIGAAFKQRDFEFLDEHALAAEARQGLVEPSVALGRHGDEFVGKARISRHEGVGDQLRLRHGKGALARRNPEHARHGHPPGT